jgi:hypothetical protein
MITGALNRMNPAARISGKDTRMGKRMADFHMLQHGNLGDGNPHILHKEEFKEAQ